MTKRPLNKKNMLAWRIRGFELIFVRSAVNPAVILGGGLKSKENEEFGANSELWWRLWRCRRSAD